MRIMAEMRPRQNADFSFACRNLFGTLIDPPPEEPCDLTCTWEALKSRAKDLVKSLLRVEVQFQVPLIYQRVI